MKRLVAVVLWGAALTLAPLLEASELRARKPISEVIPDGEARLMVFPERDVKRGRLIVPVTIDLQDVTVNDRPAVLGGYVVKVEFDPKQVVYEGVSGGLDPYFASDPFATAPLKANEKGVLRISAVQTNVALPVGMINVARLRFVEIVPGGSSSIKMTFESVASALEKDADGQFLRNLEISIEKESNQ